MNNAARMKIMPIANQPPIRICTCKGCGSRYAPKLHQSLTRCEHCQPLVIPTCLHDITLHESCPQCFEIYGRTHIRQLAQSVKPPAAKTLPRMKRMQITRRRTMR